MLWLRVLHYFFLPYTVRSLSKTLVNISLPRSPAHSPTTISFSDLAICSAIGVATHHTSLPCVSLPSGSLPTGHLGRRDRTKSVSHIGVSSVITRQTLLLLPSPRETSLLILRRSVPAFPSCSSLSYGLLVQVESRETSGSLFNALFERRPRLPPLLAMFLKPFRICALLCLILALQLATAQSFQVIRRAEDATPTAGGAPPATTKPPVETGKGDDGNNDSSSKSASGDLSASLTSTATDSHNSTASGTSTGSTPTPSLSGNSTFLNGERNIICTHPISAN